MHGSLTGQEAVWTADGQLWNGRTGVPTEGRHGGPAGHSPLVPLQLHRLGGLVQEQQTRDLSLGSRSSGPEQV